ncbi:MAG: hypothetical protein GY720_11210 [bacterium]|nr:hypothetical protein [bacterium]
MSWCRRSQTLSLLLPWLAAPPIMGVLLALLGEEASDRRFGYLMALVGGASLWPALRPQICVRDEKIVVKRMFGRSRIAMSTVDRVDLREVHVGPVMYTVPVTRTTDLSDTPVRAGLELRMFSPGEIVVQLRLGLAAARRAGTHEGTGPD